MILVGMWVAFAGYWIAYAGVAKLSGDTGCTLGRAIRGQCTPGTAGTGGPGPVPGITAADAARQHQALQFHVLPGRPLSDVAA